MKKIVCLLIFGIVMLSCSICFATAATQDSVHYLQNGIKMYKLSAVGDGYTHAVDGPVTGWWTVSTDTSDTAPIATSVSVSGATSTFTFNCSSINFKANTGTVNFFTIL